MATECTQEAVLLFIVEKGGTVKNQELVDHFKAFLTKDPDKKAEMKDAFKQYVDNIAFVKVDDGTKYVCLKKKYRASVKHKKNGPARADHDNNARGENTELKCENEDDVFSEEISKGSPLNGTPQITLNECVNEAILPPSASASMGNDDAKQEIPPVSGYRSRTDREVLRATEVRDRTTNGASDRSNASPGLLVPETNGHRSKMGSANSWLSDKINGGASEADTQKTGEQTIPKIAVIEASPLPAPSEGTVFKLPQPVNVNLPVGLSSSSDTDARNVQKNGEKCPEPTGEPQVKQPHDGDPGFTVSLKGIVRRKSRGSQRSVGSNVSDVSEDGHFDTNSMSGSDSNTPRGSRKNFIELMMNSSPQVRRSMVLRNSVYLSAARSKQDSRSDSETASIISSNTDEDSGPVPASLDPMEHEWVLCCSDGQWDSLHRLLACEPALILKRDFVTGFTCLHWAAKLGKQELLALLVNFSKQHGVPVNINVRSSAGYTPLHLAAMHHHLEVVKLLVGAYDADVDVRDYSGRKACQYLPRSVAQDLFDIAGGQQGQHHHHQGPGAAEQGGSGHGDSDVENLPGEEAGGGGSSRWRFSRVLQSNLRPLKLLNQGSPEEEDAVGGDASGGSHSRLKPLRRKSSLSKMKPKLSKMRLRTSQIVHSHSTASFSPSRAAAAYNSSSSPHHSVSFNEGDLQEIRLRSPPRARPMSSLFG